LHFQLGTPRRCKERYSNKCSKILCYLHHPETVSYRTKQVATQELLDEINPNEDEVAGKQPKK
jgi:hypothetical protein